MKKITKKNYFTFTGKFIVILIFLAFSSPENLFSQWYPNGSLGDSSFIDTIKSNISNEKLVIFDSTAPGLNVNLTIDIFIILSTDGITNFDQSKLIFPINNANQYFKKIGINFKLGKLDTIPEYEYAIISNKDSTNEVIVKYANPDKINLFLVDTIHFDNKNYFGYSLFPNKNDAGLIFLRKDFVFGNNLTSLLGNCFGLLVTHEKVGGEELVNGINCENSGDLTCDTYADGGLYQQVNAECLYFGQDKDPEGRFYEPSVANFMSDSPDECKCLFSDQQYRRMIFYYLRFLQHLK